jgi:hypothetical protein
VEALLGVGQVHIEEARFAAGVLVPAIDGVDSDAYKELNQEELEELSRTQGRDANVKLKAALEKVRVARRAWRGVRGAACVARRSWHASSRFKHCVMAGCPACGCRPSRQ